MTEKLVINDLPTNLIAVIFQFLPEKDMFMAGFTCQKFHEALQKDFLMEELVKRDIMFLPEDESRGESWKEIHEFIKKYRKAEKSGKPNKSYKSIPYRGHKTPIEAFCALENIYNFDSTIVSGDGDGNVFTWNLEEDEDDLDEKIMMSDSILKANSPIRGIKSFNGNKNIIIWTKDNKFYIYNAYLFKSPKFVKNSQRFELKCEFNIDKDDVIKQIEYDKSTDKLFLSVDLRLKYNNPIAYSYNLKTLTLEIYNFGYDNIQSEFIRKDESVQQAPQQAPHHFDLDDLEAFLNAEPNNGEVPLIDKNHRKGFVICGNKLIVYINYEPVKKQLIKKYSCKKLLPNVFFIDQETKLHKDLHIDLDYIINIIKISEDKVAFLGINDSNYLSMKIYSTENNVLLGEKILYSDDVNRVNHFNLLYSSFPQKPECYYLINHKKLYKMNLANFKQINIQEITSSMKDVTNVNWVESDKHRIVMASDDLYVSIFDISNGEFWYNFLGGSLTVFPKSYVKHPLYKGFHIVQITRNSIICAMGNLIREYKFVFKKK